MRDRSQTLTAAKAVLLHATGGGRLAQCVNRVSSGLLLVGLMRFVLVERDCELMAGSAIAHYSTGLEYSVSKQWKSLM